MSHIREDFLSPIQINAAWDPEAECPAIDRFVQRVFPYDAHEVLYQLAGLFLTPDSRRQKAVLFLGSGASGKSVATALLRTFLGHWNVSNVPLHDLTEGSFSLAELRGKLLNISADVPERDFDDTAVFKQIVDGQLATLRAPRKHRDPIEFQPFTRLLASAARVPQSADNSLGYLRRWLVVPFDTSLNESNLDRTLLDQLTTPEELSGLLNRAVAEYRQLLESGRLTESEKMARAKDGFDQESDSTRLFLKECVEESSPYEEIDRTVLYAAYKDWCVFNRNNPVSARRLYKSVWEIFRVKMNRSLTDAGCSRASSSSTKQHRRTRRCPKGRSRAGTISRKCPVSQSWTDPSLSFGECRRCGKCAFSKNFFAPGAANSPKLIQTNSTPGHPIHTASSVPCPTIERPCREPRSVRHPQAHMDIIDPISSGEVSELVDEHDLGSCAERRGSSSLPFPTTAYGRYRRLRDVAGQPVDAPRTRDSCSVTVKALLG